MPNAYEQLLDATIGQLETLQAKGERFVTVAADTLAALSKTATTRPAATSRATAPVAITSTPRPTPRATFPTPAAPVTPAAAAPAGESNPSYSFTAEDLSAPSTLSRAETERRMAELRERALACVKCASLAAARTTVVFGVGDTHSPLMFVGEAPGADEDRQGEPFVGAAGQLLTRIIQTMGQSRATVYIANILKCRPDTPGQSAGNRKPAPHEMATCLPYLLEQIELIRPRVIVALGATAMEGLFGKTTSGITKQRGHWLKFRGIPVMPTYHPAYLLRNQALAEKRRVWEDMLQVMDRLSLPISDKQRGYFLR